VLDRKALDRAMNGVDIVFHLAANPDVRLGESDSQIHFQQNVVATQNLLESMRSAGVRRMVFTSTSTVYGDARTIPTPESYGPTIPISLYGASKLASEAMISGFCHTYDIRAVIYRFANVVGPRSNHGVTFDFVNKLKKDPERLVILGNGRQKKSYTHVLDTIDAMIFGVENAQERVEVFNMGSEDYIDVVTVADIVTEVMGLEGVKYEFTGGVDGGRGWKGDVRVMQLSIERLKKMGWRPKYNSAESVRLTAESLLS
jgi:UDP-glucose 4-epimerase